LTEDGEVTDGEGDKRGESRCFHFSTQQVRWPETACRVMPITRTKHFLDIRQSELYLSLSTRAELFLSVLNLALFRSKSDHGIETL